MYILIHSISYYNHMLGWAIPLLWANDSWAKGRVCKGRGWNA